MQEIATGTVTLLPLSLAMAESWCTSRVRRISTSRWANSFNISRASSAGPSSPPCHALCRLTGTVGQLSLNTATQPTTRAARFLSRHRSMAGRKLIYLGGTDMHAQNLIANGSRPVIVDCETLFTPRPRIKASGYGDAVDNAANQILGTVLGVGMLPGRGQVLGWRGVDTSSVGALPEQQPVVQQPTILDAGTDQARWGTVAVRNFSPRKSSSYRATSLDRPLA